YGWEFAEGRALLRRGSAHDVNDSDAGRSPGAFYRFRAPGEAAGREGAILLVGGRGSLLLLRGERQEDLVVDDDAAGEQCCRGFARNRDILGVTAQRRASGLG